MNRTRAFLLAAGLAAFLAPPAATQPAAERDGPLSDVDLLLKQARREIGQFEQGGGSKQDARHPVATWVDKLWAFRERDPGTRAAGKATAEAIHLLVHADRLSEVETRADGLAADDPAWEFLAGFLFEAAAVKKDYSFLVRKLDAVVAQQRVQKVRGSLHYHLGRGQAKAGNLEAARAALKAALQEAAGTPLAKDAETALHELDNLGYGQPAPAFAGRARDGSRVALSDLRGRVVLLVFWAST